MWSISSCHTASPWCTREWSRGRTVRVSPSARAKQPESTGKGLKLPKCQNVKLQSHSWPIMTILQYYDEGMLNIHPEYQRGFVWDKQRSSRLITTIMQNLVIPQIFVHEQDDGNYDVVDGKQRLTSILAFFLGEDIGGVGAPTALNLPPDEEFEDEPWQQYNGASFTDFDVPSQKQMKNFTLSVSCIPKETDPEALISIYRNINSGSINCNHQQIRKCVFNGPYIRMLDQICKTNAMFQKLLGNDKPDDEKEQDRQYVLRFFALKRSSQQGHKQLLSLNKLLNQELLANRHLEGADTAKNMEQEFKQVVSTVYEVFGESAFKKYNAKAKKYDPKLSPPLYDTVMLGIWKAMCTGHKQQLLVKNAGAIRHGLIALQQDAAFVDALYTKAASILSRQQLFDEMVNTAVKGQQPTARRPVGPALKQKLYGQQQALCALCGEAMQDIATTEVDHIVPLAKGGSDTEANKQLVHKTCNRTKGARTHEELLQAGVFD